MAAAPTDGKKQAEHHGDGEAGQGDADGGQRGVQQPWQDFAGEFPVEEIHDRPPRIRPRARRCSSLRMAKLIVWARTK